MVHGTDVGDDQGRVLGHSLSVASGAKRRVWWYPARFRSPVAGIGKYRRLPSREKALKPAPIAPETSVMHVSYWNTHRPMQEAECWVQFSES